MSLNVAHVRDHVVIPALEYLDPEIPFSKGAVDLLLGTAAIESGFEHLVQLGGGPALGLWQMEPATHGDLHKNYLAFHPVLMSRCLFLLHQGPSWKQLATNLLYAAAMCRCHYRRFPEPLPKAGDAAGQAALWKKRYNTAAGAGTIAKYMKAYEKHVAPTRWST